MQDAMKREILKL